MMAAEESGHPSFAADFRMGEWLVEPSLDRLSRSGTVLHLRPQLIDLLVVLARHAGRTVSKDEILATVWEGQFVAESGMTRCIAEIRQALGDNARDPKIVQTIMKRGYRLVAPVTSVEPAQPPALGTMVPPIEPTVLIEPSPPPAEPRRHEDLSLPGVAEASPEPHTPADPPAAAPPSLWWRRVWAVRRPGLPVLGAASVLVLAGMAAGWSRAPVPAARQTVLVADVTNTTGDSAFDQTLRFALATQFEQAPFLRLLPASRVRAALTLMGQSPDQPVTGAIALELCRRERAAVLLEGSIFRLGSHYAVGLAVVACSNGESVAQQLLEVDSKDRVLAAVEGAAIRLRRTLGDSRASLGDENGPRTGQSEDRPVLQTSQNRNPKLVLKVRGV
jgi:eukaryotic-like serine/threonine-protein kinase